MKEPLTSWAEASIVFNIYCPKCMTWFRRVPQEAQHARLQDKLRKNSEEPVEVKCTGCDSPILVKEFK